MEITLTVTPSPRGSPKTLPEAQNPPPPPPPPNMGAVTVNGKRYTIQQASYDPTIIHVTGPRLVGGWSQRLPFDTPDMRERIETEPEASGTGEQGFPGIPQSWREKMNKYTVRVTLDGQSWYVRADGFRVDDKDAAQRFTYAKALWRMIMNRRLRGWMQPVKCSRMNILTEVVLTETPTRCFLKTYEVRMWYLIRVLEDGKVIAMRSARTYGPRHACKLVFGVIYDTPRDTAEYKRVEGGKSKLGAASRSDEGWTKIPSEGD